MTRETLRSTRRQWEKLGRADPLWAALTDPGKRGGKWERDAFFATGEREIAFVLEHLRQLGAEARYERALDFGCGVGRLTRALARRFPRCDGVDIAKSMIGHARRLNRDTPGCEFHHNTRDDLALFADGAFSLVYSVLVLQHMPRPAAERFIAEFFRVAAPGAAVVFQVPTDPYRGPVPADARRTTARAPLPAASCRATITAAAAGLRLSPGETTTLAVTVENTSEDALPSLGGPDGHLRVQLGSRWRHADGGIVTDGARTALPFDLVPRRPITLHHRVTAPTFAGDFVLELDLVQEDRAWFGELGSRPFRIPCAVREGDSPAASPSRPPPTPLLAGFRSRHPRLHAGLTALGVVPAYRAGGAFVRRWIARYRRRRMTLMDTRSIPSADVLALIRRSGGDLLDLEREETADGMVSCRYWCVKRRAAAAPPPAP